MRGETDAIPGDEAMFERNPNVVVHEEEDEYSSSSILSENGLPLRC